MNQKQGYLLCAMGALGLLMACSIGRAATPQAGVIAAGNLPTEAAAVTAIQSPAPSPQDPAPTSPPGVSPAPAATATLPPQPTATSAPLCTVLTNLNLRAGPGTAFQPPLRVLPVSTQLTPLAFSPAGFPSGQWVEVSLVGSNERGWVSAGAEFVACNIDLAGLPPSANIPPTPTAVPSPTALPTQPPQARAPEVRDPTIDGSIPDNLVGEVRFLPEAFIRMRVYDRNRGGSDGDGIAQVEFRVTDADGNPVYERTERNAAYCIFGGGEPNCNPWTLEDGAFKWKSGGQRVKSGAYSVNITVIPRDPDSAQGFWMVDLRLELP